jgi:hypothetical protein
LNKYLISATAAGIGEESEMVDGLGFESEKSGKAVLEGKARYHGKSY